MAGTEINDSPERDAILDYITRARALLDSAEKYGDNWRFYDYNARRSFIAGKICETMTAEAQAAGKARRRPGSIGARKAKHKQRQLRRQLRALESDMKTKYADYEPATPEYMPAELNGIDLEPHRPQRTVIFKNR